MNLMKDFTTVYALLENSSFMVINKVAMDDTTRKLLKTLSALLHISRFTTTNDKYLFIFLYAQLWQFSGSHVY